MKKNIFDATKYDKAKLAEYITMAQLGRSITEFAHCIGVSREYISRYIHQRNDIPPSINTLKKIADENSNINYEDLKKSCGYTEYAVAAHKSSVIETVIINTILLKVSEHRLGYVRTNEGEARNHAELVIKLEHPNNGIEYIYYYIMTGKVNVSRLINHYGAMSIVDAPAKLTIVVANKEAGKLVMDLPPVNMRTPVSVMEVKIENNQCWIIDEKYCNNDKDKNMLLLK